MSNNYGKRFLAQHNPGTSPQSKQNKSTLSPQTTPTKCGDRYIPIRLPSEDWTLRFAALNADPVGSMATGSALASNRHNNQTNPNRLNAGASTSGQSNIPAASGPASGNVPNSNNSSNNNAQSRSSEDPNRPDPFAHRALLSNELLRAKFNDIRQGYSTHGYGSASGGSFSLNRPSGSGSSPVKAGSSVVALHPSASSPGLFQYSPQIKQTTPTKSASGTPTENSGILSGTQSAPPHNNRSGLLPSSRSSAVRNLSNVYSLTPLSENSQQLLRSPRKPVRKVPKNAYKVLDAPELQDDFYLNLVDWGSQNMLAVGLGHCVYLWNASNSQVMKLCDLSTENGDIVSSVQWSAKGDMLAVGTNKGLLHIWDVASQTRLLNLSGHTFRVGCVAWNGDLVCTGSRDRMIIQRDIRTPPQVAERKLQAHKQEVCGLKWSTDHQCLASGGNDNQLLVWSLHKDQPMQTYTEHVAAVKALAWCPHQHGLLVSGGGTADRSLRFWNTLTGQAMQCVDTGSQVCNVAWSKYSKELVSTHGYSQNHIIIWKYPSLQQVARLSGHSYRVLYLATSPDGESIVTGAGDETLRFWHVFNKQKLTEARSQLNFYTSIR